MADPNILMGIKTAQFMNPLDAAAQAAQVKRANLQNAMFQQETDTQKKLDKAYQLAGGDISKMDTSGVDFNTRFKIEQLKSDQQKTAAQAKQAAALESKNRIEAASAKLTYGGQLLSGATPENWQQVRKEFFDTTGGDLGESYDPEKVRTYLAQGQSIEKQLANQYRQLGFEEDVRHHRAMESNAAARGDGGEKWKVDLEKGVRYNEMGDVVPLAGGAIQKPESAAEKSARIKVENENRLADKDFAGSLAAAAEAQNLFEGATGSGLGKTRDAAYALFGQSTEGAQKAAQLKVIAGKLVAGVPKFSGPQSDKDVQLYREMAGQVGDDSIPIETRKAALETVMALQSAEAERRKALQQPQETSAPVISHPKHGDISEDDIQATMQARGMTREQVLQKLGVQ